MLVSPAQGRLCTDSCPRLRATMATARKRPRVPRLGLLAAGRPSRSSGPRPLRLCSEHTKDTCMLRPGAQILAASPVPLGSGAICPLETLLPRPGRDFIRKPRKLQVFLQERGFPKATVGKKAAQLRGRQSHFQTRATEDLLEARLEVGGGRGVFPPPLTSLLSLQVLPLSPPSSSSGCPSPQPSSLQRCWAGLGCELLLMMSDG